MSSQESGNSDSEPELLPEAAIKTPDASRKRLTNNSASSATSKKCERAINRNVQHVFALLLGENDVEDGTGSSSDAGENDGSVEVKLIIPVPHHPKASKKMKRLKHLQLQITSTLYQGKINESINSKQHLHGGLQ